MITKQRNLKRRIGFLSLTLLLCALLPLALPCRAALVKAETPASLVAGKEYYPGGMPFGVKMATEGVRIVQTAELTCAGQKRCPAAEAGLAAGDILTALNGKAVTSIGDVAAALSSSDGKAMSVSYTRHGRAASTSLTPLIPDGETSYRAGMWIRDSMAGIGTVTFIDPETNAFGGLGHGICESGGEELIPFSRGVVSPVTVSGIVRGKPGTPGELRGFFSPQKSGALLSNTDCGVFGMFSSCPTGLFCQPIPAADPSEVEAGEATLLCTLDSGGIREYKVMLGNIDRENRQSNKSFTVTVTDPALLEKTGGIVQGMSGSPILQNGKLVGAVTHVLISDPTTGYGIFLTTMLSKMPPILQ